MATDHAIMESVGDGRQAPTLRFYGWQPACLSLGYTQRIRNVDLDRLSTRQWDIVRRPTGGGAILHVDELTYSISLPQDDPLVSGDIVTSYQRLSVALLRGLEKLNLAAEQAPASNRGVSTVVCFETPSAYEITVQGQKLVGSAQVRRQKAVLQHGTLPLVGDISRICDVLVYPDEDAREVARQHVQNRATTVERVLGRVVSWQTAAEVMAEAFAETFNLDLEMGELSPQESLRIEQLRHEVYTDEAWMYKR